MFVCLCVYYGTESDTPHPLLYLLTIGFSGLALQQRTISLLTLPADVEIHPIALQ